MEEKTTTQEQEKKMLPSLSFNDNEIVIDTFDVPINFNGEEVKIKMKKLTAGEKQILVKKNASVKIVGTQTNGTLDSIGYMIGLLTKVIVEAPFPTTEQVISSLPDDVTEYLFEEYSSHTENKKKD